MSYHQITREDRYTISALRKQGLSPADIAKHMGRHRSSIYREINHNRCNDGHYRPSKADTRTATRRSVSRRNQQFTQDDYRLVDEHLRKDWSPEQISGYFKANDLLSISHETIYRHVWEDKAEGGDLHTHLRGACKRRRKRYGAYDSRGRLAGKRHIDERCEAANERTEFGHWEIDLVHGKGSKDCIVTLVERKTRYTLIGKLKSKTKEQTNTRTLKLINPITSTFKTITADNGTEFHGFANIEKKGELEFYFATPYHSWERGTNENTNGLIRQYLPKKESMSSLTQARCNAIAKKLNSRPRKILGYHTPEEAFNAHL